MPDGICVTDFLGTSINNQIFVELIGECSNVDQLLKNLKKFKREAEDTAGNSPKKLTTLFDDLKVFQKALAQ